MIFIIHVDNFPDGLVDIDGLVHYSADSHGAMFVGRAHIITSGGAAGTFSTSKRSSLTGMVSWGVCRNFSGDRGGETIIKRGAIIG